jgi:4-amino-4-deoxy-L-arabinose transferase-like glycosyltransferase
LILLAVVLRFWHLGDWNFQATEMFTLRDSVRPQFKNPRPLGYLLNYFLVRPIRPLDELGLRILPAVFGVLAVPALYLAGRPLVGRRAALFGALLLSVSSLLILYSQLSRYWSLVFLLCAIYPYALYLGVRDRNVRALVIGVVTAVLAVLAHPVSLLLIGGPAIWLVFTVLRPSRLRQLWTMQGFRWGVLAAVILAVIIAVRFVPILQAWVSEHDKNPGSGQFLLRTPPPPGLKQLYYVLAYAESLTVPLTLGALVGAYILWRYRDRSLAMFLISLAVFPVVFLALITLRTPVSQYYLLPTTPAFFLAAGVFLDQIAATDWKVRPHWLITATIVTIFVAAGVPTIISDHRDGRRYDFRGAARWLERRLRPGDVVFSDQYMVLAHYLPTTDVQRLRELTPLDETARELEEKGGTGVLWLVAPAPSHPFRTNLKRGGLIDWIYDHCQLRHTQGVGRVDLRQHYLQVYRCPAAPPGVLPGRTRSRPTPPR